MNEWTSSPEFEENIRRSFGVPDIRPEFVNHVNAELLQRAEARSRKPHHFLGLRPAWTVTLAILTLMIITTLVIGPQRVYAEFARLLGYIPGVGVVNQTEPIRVLAEPVSVTRDGITVTVTSVTLTADRTQIDYRIFGIPMSAYPDREDVLGCIQREYLRLEDGTQLAQINFGYEPVPEDVNEAIFVIPCFSNTLPGKTPEDWEIPLRFIPAPPDLTVMPVIELTPSLQVSQSQSSTAVETPLVPSNNPVTVLQEIETSEGYILIGQFQPQTAPGESFQQTGRMEIVDATGKTISTSYPQDVNEDVNLAAAGIPGAGWAAQFKAAGLSYPLTIRFSGYYVEQAYPEATTSFTFDAGTDPQPGQTWNLDQEVQLAGHSLTITSITASRQDSYSFNFKVGPEIYGVAVNIEGTSPNGGGGGGVHEGVFFRSLAFPQLPTGVLTVTLSDLELIGKSATWEVQWSPVVPRTDLPANPTPQPGLCLTTNSLEHLLPAPDGLFKGTALMNEQLENSESWGMVLYNLDGSGKQVLASNIGVGALSPDGTRMAYSMEDGIHAIDLATNADTILTSIPGMNLQWSPYGQEIAFEGFNDDRNNTMSIVNVNDSQVRQVYEGYIGYIVGWSADGEQLYSVTGYTGGAAWKVNVFNLADNTMQELFTIENGTPKYLNPTLSLDGLWIAYRGRDNSSVYLVHPDGSDMHLLLNSVDAVGIEWSRSGWLGVSLRLPNSDESMTILINPEECEVYQLNAALHGELEGLSIP